MTEKTGSQGIGALKDRGIKTLMRKAVRYGVMIAAIPIALMIIYIIPLVHPISTLMLKDLVTLKGYDRQWVAIEDIAPALIYSVMMSEDGQFCAHSGVDWAAVNQVVDDAIEGEPSRGASTIAMQSVKNLFLWSSRSVIRKVIELPYALAADFIWSKRRLMELYLNIAEWGPGIYGIEAAAQRCDGRIVRGGQPREMRVLVLAGTTPIYSRCKMGSPV